MRKSSLPSLARCSSSSEYSQNVETHYRLRSNPDSISHYRYQNSVDRIFICFLVFFSFGAAVYTIGLLDATARLAMICAIFALSALAVTVTYFFLVEWAPSFWSFLKGDD